MRALKNDVDLVYTEPLCLIGIRYHVLSDRMVEDTSYLRRLEHCYLYHRKWEWLIKDETVIRERPPSNTQRLCWEVR